MAAVDAGLIGGDTQRLGRPTQPGKEQRKEHERAGAVRMGGMGPVVAQAGGVPAGGRVDDAGLLAAVGAGAAAAAAAAVAGPAASAAVSAAAGALHVRQQAMAVADTAAAAAAGAAAKPAEFRRGRRGRSRERCKDEPEWEGPVTAAADAAEAGPTAAAAAPVTAATDGRACR